ncbi:hypothetical protein AVEN_120831-1, partial [Araneus ventricosus]
SSQTDPEITKVFVPPFKQVTISTNQQTGINSSKDSRKASSSPNNFPSKPSTISTSNKDFSKKLKPSDTFKPHPAEEVLSINVSSSELSEMDLESNAFTAGKVKKKKSKTKH